MNNKILIVNKVGKEEEFDLDDLRFYNDGNRAKLINNNFIGIADWDPDKRKWIKCPLIEFVRKTR